MYTRVGMGGTPVCTPGWVWWVYILPTMPTLYYPGYTLHPPTDTAVPLRLHRGIMVRDDDALGSTLGYPLGERLFPS